MARFIEEQDYDMQIRQEIRKLLDGSSPGVYDNYKLVMAEDSAQDQIRNYLGNRYDCNKIFEPASPTHTRDRFMVMLTIDLALYHLYSQTGWKDIPKHRNDRYADALEWLKMAGKGAITTNLPAIEDGGYKGDVRIISRPADDPKW